MALPRSHDLEEPPSENYLPEHRTLPTADNAEAEQEGYFDGQDDNALYLDDYDPGDDGDSGLTEDVRSLPKEPQAPSESHPRFVLPVSHAHYTPDEEATLAAAFESLDGAQIFAATRYIQHREMEALEQRMLSAQVSAADDPYEPMVRRNLYELSKQHPDVYNDPQALEAARFSAAFQIGAQQGDIRSAVARYLFSHPEAMRGMSQGRRPAPAPLGQRMPAPSVSASPDPMQRGSGGYGPSRVSNSILREINHSLGGGMTDEESRALHRAFQNSRRR